MKLSFKSIYTSVFVLAAAVLYIGCSSAEQTSGKLAFNNKDYAKAETEFQKEVNANAQNEEAWFYLAMSRLELGKISGFEEAMKGYRAVGKNTFAQDLYYKWGEKYDEGASNFDKASKSTDTAVSMPLYKKALINFKSCLVLQPDSLIAQKNVDVISNKITTIKVKPLIDKGATMMEGGDYAGAIDMFKQAETSGIDKNSPAGEVLTYNTGLAYLKWGENMRANNQADESFKDKYRAALPYLESLKNSNNKDNKLQAYELLVQVYANLNMTAEYEEAKKVRDELKK